MDSRRGNLLLSVDLEDWFQAESLAKCIKRDSWANQQLRVEQNVNKILQVLSDFNVQATFFCLGWIAERVPHIVTEIADLGHEVASHGYFHRLVYQQEPKEFASDIRKAKLILEDITGQNITGYRAPTFSITDWAFPILRQAGYRYDSSLVITDIHDRYGSVLSASKQQPGDFFEIYSGIHEFSLPCLKVKNISVPWGGGGYFRLLPLKIYLSGLEKILAQKDFVFYFHPWELDTGQPRVPGMSWQNQFRHYVNISRTETKLRGFLSEYSPACITFNSYLQKFRKTKSLC